MLLCWCGWWRLPLMQWAGAELQLPGLPARAQLQERIVPEQTTLPKLSTPWPDPGSKAGTLLNSAQGSRCLLLSLCKSNWLNKQPPVSWKSSTISSVCSNQARLASSTVSILKWCFQEGVRQIPTSKGSTTHSKDTKKICCNCGRSTYSSDWRKNCMLGWKVFWNALLFGETTGFNPHQFLKCHPVSWCRLRCRLQLKLRCLRRRNVFPVFAHRLFRISCNLLLDPSLF